MAPERLPHDVTDVVETSPGLSEDGIQFLRQLNVGKQPEITDRLRIQFRGVAGYLGKANAAIQWFDYGNQYPGVNNLQELRKIHFIVKHVFCPIVYPGMPVAECWWENRDSLHQRIKSFQRICYGPVDGRRLLPEEIKMIPQLIDFMRGLQTQYPSLREEFDRTYNKK